jgi:hypothetical protein
MGSETKENKGKSVNEGYAKSCKKGRFLLSLGFVLRKRKPWLRILSKAVGYSEVEMNAVPEGANLGLGCG